jgi:hypothetical protein
MVSHNGFASRKELFADLGGGAFSAEMEFEADYTELYTRISSGSIGDTITVTSLVVKEIVVEETSEILNVSAQSGSIVNKYTGDSIGDNLVTNGTFDTDTGWTKTAGWTISNGEAHADGAELQIYQDILTDGETYNIYYQVTSYTSGTIRPLCGTGGGGTAVTAVGVYSETLVCSGNTVFYLDGGSGANAFTGSLDNVIVRKAVVAPTITATTVVKDGEARVMKFDGADSKVDCGVPDTLVGDKTFIAWVKINDYGENGQGMVISNGGPSISSDNEFVVYLFSGTPGVFFFRSRPTPLTQSAASAYELNKWVHLVITRTSSGTTNFYINGVANGTGDQAGGDPIAGTTNIIIGNDDTSVHTWDGLIDDVRIYDGLLTAAEISQLFSAERKKYGI